MAERRASELDQRMTADKPHSRGRLGPPPPKSNRLGQRAQEAKSGIPRKPADSRSLEALLDLASRRKFNELAERCVVKQHKSDLSVQRTRYHIVSVAVHIFTALENEPDCLARFNLCFKAKLNREVKKHKLLRDVLLFLHSGSSSSGMAGTDAIAIAGTIREKVPAAQIPEYIKKKGGLESLLKAERRFHQRKTVEPISEPEEMLRIRCALDEGQKIKDGPAEGLWALITSTHTRNGAAKSLRVVRTLRTLSVIEPEAAPKSSLH